MRSWWPEVLPEFVKNRFRTLLRSMSLLALFGGGNLMAQIRVTVSPASVTLTAGTAKSFTAAVSGTGNTGVTWSVRESGGGTISSKYGSYTASGTPGTYHVRATSKASASAFGESTVTVVAVPNASISALASVTAGQPGLSASVPTVTGSAYVWTISGGTITSGASSSVVTYTAGSGTSLTLTCKVTNAAGRIASGSKFQTIVLAPFIAGFSVNKSTVTLGNPALLIPIFADGTGTITPGVGAVTSGSAVSVTPNISTTYVLTVTNSLGYVTSRSLAVNVVAAPTISGFTAAKTTVTVGNATSLTALFNNGTATISGLGAVAPGSAISTGNLSANTTYTLTVTNGAGDSVIRTLTVSVATAPVITAFTTAKATLSTGSATTLNASFSGGLATIDHGLGSIAPGAPVSTGVLTNSTTFTLTLTNDAGDSVSRQVTINVVALPAISGFSALKPTLTSGGGTTLNATFSNGSGSINNGLGSIVSGASLATGILTATTTFRLTVTNEAGDSTYQDAQVRVIPSPVIDSFSASKTLITAGSSTQLTALFSGGTATLDQGLGTVNSGVGINSGSLTQAAIFTLTVTNEAGDSVTQQASVNVVAAPVITAFTAAKTTITTGKATSLLPTFTGGTGVIDNGIGAVNSGASIPTALLSANTAYTLTVTNEAGDHVTQQVSVNVVAAPDITAFTAAKSPVTTGMATSLLPTFTGGTGVIDNEIGAVNSGTAIPTALLSANTTYTLTVTNEAGESVTQQVPVNVVAAPAITGFSAAKSPLTVDNGTSLLATFANGTATVDHGIGTVNSGEVMVTGNLTTTTTYTLTVANAAGDTATQQAVVNVVPAPGISGFTSSLSQIFAGQSVQLTPIFSGGTGAIDSGVGAVSSGQEVAVTPSSTTSYTLTVTNAAGDTVTSSLTTTVDTQPVVITSFTSVSPQVNFGDSVELDWSVSGQPTALALNGHSVLGTSSDQTVYPVRRSLFTLSGSNPIGGDSKELRIPARGLDFVAGSIGSLGNIDGKGTDARFNSPGSVAVATDGNVYVADRNNHVIRKISPDGVVSVFAGAPGISGSTDGPAATAKFYIPDSVAVDAAGSVYVADTGNSTIRKITPDGTVLTLAGLAGNRGSTDGIGSSARFDYPAGVAVDALGNVFVADTSNYTIRKVSTIGIVTTLAGSPHQVGTVDGIGSAARFCTPRNLALDAAGNLIVPDTDFNVIRKVSQDGVVTTLAGLGTSAGFNGYVDGMSTSARFNQPYGVAIDGSGNIYVGDSGNHRIRKIAPSGMVSTVAGDHLLGNGYLDGQNANARFSLPSGLAITPDGLLLVAERMNSDIRRIDLAGSTSTLAGQPPLTPSVSGTSGTQNPLYFNSSPEGVAVDADGNIYVADTGAHVIRKVSPDGVMSTFAGTYGSRGSTDGQSTSSKFNGPRGVTLDAQGNLFVADTGNYTIRKITMSGMVSTFAGSAGVSGATNGVGGLARFGTPFGLATDGSDNVYVADTSNNTIRKITPSGMVSTLAGVAGSYGSSDGTGTLARFDTPKGIASDILGNLFVADYYNNTIRKITPAGTVTTLAGLAGARGNANGSGSAARFNDPSGVAVDASGNVYVADSSNHLLRKISPSGAVSTFAGVVGKMGIQRGILPASLYLPKAIAMDRNGDLYMTAYNGLVVITAP